MRSLATMDRKNLSESVAAITIGLCLRTLWGSTIMLTRRFDGLLFVQNGNLTTLIARSASHSREPAKVVTLTFFLRNFRRIMVSMCSRCRPIAPTVAGYDPV